MKVALFLLLWISVVLALNAPNPPTTGAFASGTYRNLFAEMGYSSSQIQSKLTTAYNSLFGGGSSSTVYYSAGNGMGYILDVANNDVRTEGMSYGMMVAVQMNDQTTFDAIFKWAVTYMRYNTPSDPNYLYYKWQASTSGSILGNSPASDGEEYFVTALIFAAGRWGTSANFNYRTEYQNLLYHLIHVPSNTQGVTNLFDASTHQVVFCPTGTAATYTDPSYHLPAFYEVWSRAANNTADATFWSTAASSARTYFQAAINSNGLNPDYSNFDGSVFTGSGSSGHTYFAYDAWRTIANLGVDYAWWAKDSTQVTIANRALNFFASKGASYPDQYNLDGSAVGSTHSLGHVACNAVGGLASNNNVTWSYVQELWNAQAPTGTYRYYGGLLYILGFLHVSGNFKIYLPGSSSGGSVATVATVAAAASSSSSAASTATHASSASSSVASSVSSSSSSSSGGGNSGVVVFDDALQNGYQDWSWVTHSLTATTYVHSGTKSISFEVSNYGGVYFHNPTAFTSNTYTSIKFWLRGTASGQNVQVLAYNSASVGTAVSVGAAPVGSWSQITVPFSSFNLAGGTSLSGFAIAAGVSADLGVAYIDDVTLN